MMNKKGQAIEGLQSLIAPLVGVAIVLVVGFLILSQAKEQIVKTQIGDMCASGYSLNNSVPGEFVCCNSTGPTCCAGNTTAFRGTFAYNGTSSTQEAISDIPGWLPIIVITIIGSLLIGLVAYFRNQ